MLTSISCNSHNATTFGVTGVHRWRRRIYVNVPNECVFNGQEWIRSILCSFCCWNHDSFNAYRSIESYILHSIESNMYRSNPFDWNAMPCIYMCKRFMIVAFFANGFHRYAIEIWFSAFTNITGQPTGLVGTWNFGSKTSWNCVLHKLIPCKCLHASIVSHELNSPYRILTKSFGMKRINQTGHSVTLHLTNFRCSVLILDQITYLQI